MTQAVVTLLRETHKKDPEGSARDITEGRARRTNVLIVSKKDTRKINAQIRRWKKDTLLHLDKD